MFISLNHLSFAIVDEIIAPVCGATVAAFEIVFAIEIVSIVSIVLVLTSIPSGVPIEFPKL